MLIRSIAGFLAAAFLIAGCSEESSSLADENTSRSDRFDDLFEAGFEDGKARALVAGAGDASATRAGAASQATRSIQRSSDRTREIEAMVADGISENLSVRMLMPNPDAFVRTGKARQVYERELGARNLPGDTVAGASALLFAVAWEIANGRKLSQADHAAILAQASESLDADIPATDGNDALHVRADTALTIAGLWLEEARVRASDPERTREFSDAVQRDMLRMSGTDMRQRKVVAEGFAPR